MSNQECKVRPIIVSINSNEPLFYPHRVIVNKCCGSCNEINNPFAKLCVPDVVKNMNIKVFNLISGTNEMHYISWYETCACKFRLDTSVCNNKYRWNSDKCRCECKKIDW